jgi:ABC-type glycerol-3-phosphate transport system permease component
VGTDITNANIAIAAALIVALPVLLLLIAFSRQIIRGLTAGAVKG